MSIEEDSRRKKKSDKQQLIINMPSFLNSKQILEISNVSGPTHFYLISKYESETAQGDLPEWLVLQLILGHFQTLKKHCQEIEAAWYILTLKMSVSVF